MTLHKEEETRKGSLEPNAALRSVQTTSRVQNIPYQSIGYQS